MGLMDKFKNLFTDEEVIEEDDDDVEIKEITKEVPKLPTFMREKIAKEEKGQDEVIQTPVLEDNEVSKELKLEKKIGNDMDNIVLSNDKPVFKFPIDLEEGDFTETRSSRQQSSFDVDSNERSVDIVPSNISSYNPNDFARDKRKNVEKKELKVSELYKDKKEEVHKDEKRFRATPIISPIYGVVDKNYNPDDVDAKKGRNFENHRPSKNVDFDSVRKKAYGSVAKEMKKNLMCDNCEYMKESEKCKNDKRSNDDDCYREEYENITLDEATENYYDYGVAYEKQPVKNDVKHDDDKYYLDDDNEVDDVAVHDYSEESEPVGKREIPPVKSSINLLSTLKKSMGDEENDSKEKNLELTDDLFNIIDSMYDERNDN